jgi:hypothetical protein
MLDMALYLTIFGVVGVRVAALIHPYFTNPNRLEEIAYVSFGLHLGNYFWSGVAKLFLGPHFWTWAIENQTFNTILYAATNGTLPIGHFPSLVQAAYTAAQVAVHPLNIAIVGCQIFAVVSPLRRLWLKAASVIYDVLHLGIWILGGLFFWPWVWNNITIFVAASSQRSRASLSAKLACVLAIVLGFPSLPYYKAAWLAWFDVADARQTYFEAVTEDGRRARVPSSFFLSHSYSVSHGFMDTASHAGHFGFTLWGSSPNYERLLSSGKCIAPKNTTETESDIDKTARLERVGKFVRAHHAKMLSRRSWLGPHSYYYSRLHHHPSNPFLFAQFNNMRLSDIVAYNLVVESVCHRLKEGVVIPSVLGRTEERFVVR